MSIFKPRRSGVLLAVAVMSAGLAACAGGSESTPAASSGTASSEASTSTIRYIDVGNILASYPRLQAETAGYFDAEGVKVEMQSNIANANQIVQAVANGQADMALTGGTGPLALATTTRSVKVVAVLGSPAPLQVALNDAALAKLAAKGVTPQSPYADKVAALQGLKLATYPTGSTTDLLFREALIKAGQDPDKLLTIQPFTDPTAITAAARQGKSDGIIAFPNQSTEPQADGWGKTYIDFLGEAKDSVDVPYIVAIANPTFLRDNPQTVSKFLAAMVKSRDDAKNLTDAQGAALKAAYFAKQSDASFQAGLDAIRPAFAGSLVPTEDAAARLLTIFNRTQKTPLDVPFDTLYDVSLIKALPGA